MLQPRKSAEARCPFCRAEAAVNHRDEHKVRETIAAAISAATARSRELGK